MVDASLVGLDQGNSPRFRPVGQWEACEGARQALLPNLSRATPATRYGVGGQRVGVRRRRRTLEEASPAALGSPAY